MDRDRLLMVAISVRQQRQVARARFKREPADAGILHGTGDTAWGQILPLSVMCFFKA